MRASVLKADWKAEWEYLKNYFKRDWQRSFTSDVYTYGQIHRHKKVQSSREVGEKKSSGTFLR